MIIHLALFLKLAIAHFLCDFPLQGDFLAAAKNHAKPIPNVPWQWALIAHSAIQAGGVWYVTNSLTLGCIEFFAHGVTDWLKSEGRISFGQDQAIHLVCKVLYVVFIWKEIL